MFFQEPNPTKYDLCFKIWGIPVRVHPAFWLVGIILGSGGGVQIERILIWTGSLFISILIHELGHAFVMRRFGEIPRVSLYWGGGLAISDGTRSNIWGRGRRAGRNTFEQVVISFAGPAAGFAFAGLIVLSIYLMGGSMYWAPDAYMVLPDFKNNNVNPLLWMLTVSLLFINIFWGLVNLLPVYPLDGGQISRALFTHYDPADGVRQSLWLSVFAGALAAIAGFMYFGQPFMAILFGMLAYSSFQSIQAINTGGFGGGFRGGRPW